MSMTKASSDAELLQHGIGVMHHFAGRVYAKETYIPAGTCLAQHIHKYDHLSALMKGSAVVVVDDAATTHKAPALLTIMAGKAHQVIAITDVVWACIHATDETDPDKVDAGLIA